MEPLGRNCPCEACGEIRAKSMFSTAAKIRGNGSGQLIANRLQLEVEKAVKGMDGPLQAFSAQFDPHGLYVYLLWGNDPDRPVYVGQSSNILARLGDHMRDATKRSIVKRVQVVNCEDKAKMDELEASLILAYQPVLNIRGL
jgi:hypothetical protein